MAGMNSNRIDNKFEIKGGKVVITETYRKEMTREDLQSERIKYLNLINGINQQIASHKVQRESFVKAIAEIDQMEAELPPMNIDEE